MRMYIRWTGLFLLIAGLLAGCNGQAPQVSNPGTASIAPTQGGGAKQGGAKSDEAADVPVSDDINPPPDEVPAVGTKLELSDEQWRERLTKAQYRVLRTAGTEFPGTGAYNKLYAEGTYHCSACNNPLFASDAKFDSKTGWPSFYQPIEEGRVTEVDDSSHGMTRTEVLCAVCDGHLGHVFNDGPEPTGLRYCINSVSLYFRPDAAESDAAE